ncbi:hypothetical protein A4A49_60563, partial [Nicotiana attenuata]
MVNLAGGQPSSPAGLPPQPPPNIALPSITTNNNPTPLDYSKILKPATMNSAMHDKAVAVDPIPLLRDNRGKNAANQKEIQGKTGKDIVPTRQENIAIEKVANQGCQTANKFAVLEVEDGDNNDNNQLVVVEDNSKEKSPAQSIKSTGKLNPSAPTFRPAASGIDSSKIGDKTKASDAGKGDKITTEQGGIKESTAQWVGRTFADNVATNQSCQEIPSQSVDFTAIDGITEGDEREQLNGKKLWLQQIEEDTEEGELPDGASGEEESTDEENDQEEQSVNK